MTLLQSLVPPGKGPIITPNTLRPQKGTIPAIRRPQLPIPPGVGAIIPPRTITSFIPPRVRDIARFAALPEVLGVGSGPAPRNPEIDFNQFADSSAYEGKAPRGVLRAGFLTDQEDPNDVMRFQFNPSEVKIDHKPGWIVTQTPGRSHPFVQYGGSGQRTVSFRLQLAFTLNEVGNVADNVNWIHSFMFPKSFDASGGVITAPAIMMLYLGQILGRQNNAQDVAPVILLDAPVRYFSIFRPENLSPQRAEIDLTFLMLLADPKITTSDDHRTDFGAEDRRVRNAAKAKAIAGTPRVVPIQAAPPTARIPAL